MSNEIKPVIATQLGSRRLCVVTKHAELLSGKSFDQTADQHQGSYVRMRLLGEKDSDGRQRITLDELEAISMLWKKWQRRTYRPCKHCATEMEISLAETGFRRHRVFCTDNCKSKDYHRRQRTAKKLWESEMSVSNIAKQVDTKPVTVRGWVKKWSVV